MEARPPIDHFNPHEIRKDFPILGETMRDRNLVYLDNAASTQKPKIVIDRIRDFYLHEYANIHRGVYLLSQKATEAYEAVRKQAQQFIHAADEREIVFVRGTTEAINLVAHSYGKLNISEGDEVLISAMEHHSNIVPWQILCQNTGAKLRIAPMDSSGNLQMDEFEKLLNARTKLVAVVHVSNALGTVNPIREIVDLAHQREIPVLVDGAQAVSHMPVDVQELDCDFYACSAHKMFGPTGVGFLYGKSRWLEAMPPYQGGGDMIRTVTFEKTTYSEIPHKFEAGTPNIADVIGLGAALEYLSRLDLNAVQRYEAELLEYGTRCLQEIPGVQLIGQAREKEGVLSFVIEGIHPHDIGTILDMQGIAIRAGHHCAQPVMDFFEISSTARASIALYNTREDLDALMEGLHEVIRMLG